MKIQKNVLILVGLISLAYILIFLLAQKDITDYTIVDTGYSGETGNRLMIKTAYDYNSEIGIEKFPNVLGDWTSYDYKYPESVYKALNADILLSRTYMKNDSVPIWIDFINSKTGESFHKQKICVTGAGWNIDKESVQEFKIADPPNPFTKLYVNRLDLSKGNMGQLMIYWFMFKKFGNKDAVTMIRISAPVNNDDTDGTFNTVKDFLEGQLFGAMYKGTEAEEITNAEYLSRYYGNKGLITMAAGILIPIGIIATGIRKKD